MYICNERQVMQNTAIDSFTVCSTFLMPVGLLYILYIFHSVYNITVDYPRQCLSRASQGGMPGALLGMIGISFSVKFHKNPVQKVVSKGFRFSATS